MDCKTARLLLNFDRPRSTELEGDDAQALAGHLAECPDCAAIRHFEHQIDERLGHAIHDVPLPPGLRDRLLAGLTVQPPAWYRRRSVHMAASIAATILAAVLGWHFFFNVPSRLDIDGFYRSRNDLPSSAEEVLQSLQRQGLHAELPPNFAFNYNCLTFCEPGLLQGRTVPILEFQNGSDRLRVYILDGRRFNLTGLVAQSGRVSLQPWIVPGSRFGWLFEYTGHSLEPFKARDSLPPA
jgi:hypothetical protein